MATEELQEQYWALTKEYAKAVQNLNKARRAVFDFLAAHPNETFKVFTPEDVQAMLREEVEIWEL